MGRIATFEIELTFVYINQIMENLYGAIEITNNNKIKNIYKILDKSKDAICLSSSLLNKTSIKIKLRHDQWVKIIECCQSRKHITEHLENKIDYLKKYQRNRIN
jgi:Na+/phosphate symporter